MFSGDIFRRGGVATGNTMAQYGHGDDVDVVGGDVELTM